MIQAIKNWLYDIITSYGLVFRLMPIFKRFFMRFIIYAKPNFLLVDEGNATMIATKYSGKIYPAVNVEWIAGIEDLRIRKDDVLLCGYPKTGCHWAYEIVHMLLTGKAEMSKYGKRIGGMLEGIPPLFLDSLPSPRMLNSHMLYEELPLQIKEWKTKIIWTVRNPKDTVVSYYNHTQALKFAYEYEGTFENYFKLFVSGQHEYGNYFDYILKWENAMESQNNNPIFVVEFEQLKKHPLMVVKNIAEFLNIDITDEFAQEIIDKTTFSAMKAKRGGSKLFRKGQVGDWRNWLTDAQSTTVDKIWKERMMNCFYQPDL